MKRKAQITLIILIALLILLVAAFLIYISNYYKKTPSELLVFEKGSIENYILSCIKKTAENSLTEYGKQGFVAPDIAGIEAIQTQLSFFVSSNLDTCLNSFRDFEKQGWKVEKNSFDAKFQINQNDVSVDVAYPVEVSDGENTISFERFGVILDVRLKEIHDLASNISEFKEKYNKEVDLSMLSEHDFEVTIFPDSGFFVYVIDDPKSLIMNRPYRFVLKIKA